MSGISINYAGIRGRPEIIRWLRENMECARLSDSGAVGYDKDGEYVYVVYTTSNSVYFSRAEDAALFALTWT